METRVAGINRVGGETNHLSKDNKDGETNHPSKVGEDNKEDGEISLSKVGEDSKEDGEINHPNKVGEIKGAKEDGELSELEYYDFDYFKT